MKMLKAHMEKEGFEFDDILNPKNRPTMKGAILAIRALKDKTSEKFLEGIAQDERNFRLPIYEELAKNPKLKKGLMKKITDELPIASALDGSEPMVVGDISFDKNTSKEIFGTDNWNEITERLVLIHSERLPYIGYQAKTKKEVIPISKLEIIGHGSGTVNFDLMMHIDKRFADKMRAADEKIYGKAKKESIELRNLLDRLILEEERKEDDNDWSEIMKTKETIPSKLRTILENDVINEGTKEQIKKMWELIDDEDFDEAQKIVSALEKTLGKQNPELVRARKLIKFLEGKSLHNIKFTMVIKDIKCPLLLYGE